MRYGLFNNFNDAGTLFLDSRIDNFFIAAFMNSVAVGIYSFYMRLNEMAINVLPGRLFDNIIQPMFFAVKPAEADERLPQYFTFLVNANLVGAMADARILDGVSHAKSCASYSAASTSSSLGSCR